MNHMRLESYKARNDLQNGSKIKKKSSEVKVMIAQSQKEAKARMDETCTTTLTSILVLKVM